MSDRASGGAKTVRIGAVNYLNSKPLIYGLEQHVPTAELVLDLPSRLADALVAGRLDVALIPSIEFFLNPGYAIVSDACIACRGPVLSVKLFSRTPVAQIGTLALDEGSRTSVALVRILLREKYGLAPRLLTLPVGMSIEECDADAVLVIGDRAIHSPAGPFAEIWDLGDEWCQWAELPFVFAMWVAREDMDRKMLGAALSAVRDDGLANLERIAAEESARLGLTRPQCLAYLRDNLHFSLGDQERRGLELFHRLSAEIGLVTQPHPPWNRATDVRPQLTRSETG